MWLIALLWMCLTGDMMIDRSRGLGFRLGGCPVYVLHFQVCSLRLRQTNIFKLGTTSTYPRLKEF